jgi:hypothetical protein
MIRIAGTILPLGTTMVLVGDTNFEVPDDI